MTFKTSKPAAQPRTLRTIAESNKGSFPLDAAFDYQGGVPLSVPGAGQAYQDGALAAQLNSSGRQGAVALPTPFALVPARAKE